MIKCISNTNNDAQDDLFNSHRASQGFCYHVGEKFYNSDIQNSGLIILKILIMNRKLRKFEVTYRPMRPGVLNMYVYSYCIAMLHKSL